MGYSTKSTSMSLLGTCFAVIVAAIAILLGLLIGFLYGAVQIAVALIVFELFLHWGYGLPLVSLHISLLFALGFNTLRLLLGSRKEKSAA